MTQERVTLAAERLWRSAGLTTVTMQDGNLTEALHMLREMEELAEEARQIMVTRLRNLGHSWQEIGDALGTSRQAAQQRYGKEVN